MKTDCTVAAVFSGPAYLSWTTVEQDNTPRYQIHDTKAQLDHYLDRNKTMCNGQNAYTVMNEPNLYINFTYVPTALSRAPTWVGDTSTTAMRNNAHFNYMEHRNIKFFNMLNNDISMLDCLSDNSRAQRAYVMSKHSRILAAKIMGLPACWALESFWHTGVITECRQVNATFTGKPSQCGMQPDFENQTISRDGITLRKHSPCYWKNSYSCFDGNLYQYKNNSYEVLLPNIAVSSIQARSQFKIEVDRTDLYFAQTFEHEQQDMFGLLGELTELMQHLHTESLAQFVHKIKNQNTVQNTVSIMDEIKYALIAIRAIAVCLVVLYVAWNLRFCYA